MKILFVSQYFFPETFRGNDIVFDLVKKEHDVTVLTGKPNYPLGRFYKGYKFWGVQKEEINGAYIIRIPTISRGNGGGFNLILNYLSFALFSYPFSRFKVDKNFDIIFVQQLSPVFMALPAIWSLKRNINAKLYIWILDLWPESLTAVSSIKNSTIIKLIDKLVCYIYSKADYILISSKFFESSVYKRSNNKKIFYFPNWAESIYESESPPKFDLPQFPAGFNIVFAGNIGEAQDFETILKAAELTINEKINWILIGSGRKVDWVRKQIERNSLKNVIILGRYPIEMMPAFFKIADVMLLSLKDSPVFNLTVPAKLQAYLSSGKIILGAINGEANLIINDNYVGVASEAGNFKTLSENAIFLRNLPIQEKIKMENNSRKLYYSKFSKSLLLDKLENSFKLNCTIE